MVELIIGENEAGQRFDKYLTKYLSKAPSSFTYKMLRKKNITLNGIKASGSEKLKTGDRVKMFLSDETIEKFSEQVKISFPVNALNPTIKNEFKKSIIYEDENVLFLNKKAGILSQKADKNDVSINEYMIDYLISSKKLKEEELRTFKPSVCNRLDRNTSGLITCGKSLVGLQELSRLFKERGVDKYYITVVNGIISEKERIKGYLKKDEANNKSIILKDDIDNNNFKDYHPIETEYEPLYNGTINFQDGSSKKYTVLKVKLITGKTHQIRAHLSSVGHGCIGDVKYGNWRDNEIYQKNMNIRHQLLHSYELDFESVSGPLSYLNGKKFKAELPTIYNVFWKREK